MNLSKIRIDGIPAILWGDPGGKIIIAAHGSHSSKFSGYADKSADRP